MHVPVDYLTSLFEKLRVRAKRRKHKKRRETYIPLRCMDGQQARWGNDYIPNDKYKHVRGLERGFEGFCILSKSKRTGKLIVMKNIPCRKNTFPKEAEMLLKEIRPHPNIVRAFAAQREPKFYRHTAIHLEYCSGGDLIDQLSHFRALERATPPIFAMHVFIGLTNALAYLHHGIWRSGSILERDSIREQDPIIHCDIKPDNVLLRWRGDPICGMPDIVLADFGAAQFENNSWGCDGGTYDYLSPEARAVVDLAEEDKEAFKKAKRGKILTAKSDIYSLGVLMHLVAAGRHWSCGENPELMDLPAPYARKPTTEADSSNPTPAFICGFQFALIWCLRPDPKDRPECSNKLKHGGILMSMDSLRRQRDCMFTEDDTCKKSLEGVWNMNITRAPHEDEGTPAQRFEAMSLGKRRRGLGRWIV